MQKQNNELFYNVFFLFKFDESIFKKIDESKFSWSARLFKHICFTKMQPNMTKQEKNDKESMNCLTLKPSQKISKIIRVSLWPLSSLDINSLDYAIRGILESKTSVTFLPNIGSLKTVIEEEPNKMSEKFMMKAYKSFWRHVDTITEKK